MRGSREGQGPGTPWKYHKNIGFLSNTIIYLDRLKNHKAIKPTNIGQSVARQRNAIKIAFRWRGGGGGGGDDGPPLVPFGSSLPLPPHQKKCQKLLDPRVLLIYLKLSATKPLAGVTVLSSSEHTLLFITRTCINKL